MTKHESRNYKSWFAVSKVLTVITLTLIMASMLTPSAWGQYKILYNFTGGADGSQPYDAFILDTSGNLYGTTTAGGASGNGAVVKLTKNSDGSWTESVLYSFAGGTDGANPQSEVTFDASGNLYGTTWSGGNFSAGTVFQLVPNSSGGGTWTENVLYSFTGGSDGANPEYGVILDAKGNLYGATSGGGTQGMGVVYKLAPNSDGKVWTYSALHSFTGGNDGSYPLYQGKLTFDTAGNLYGATSDGVDAFGDCPSGNDCGSIFELTPQSNGSWKEQVIFRFNGDYGVKAVSPVIFDSAGSLYGNAGGGGDNYGVAFKLTLGTNGTWSEDVLHVFQGNQDGAYPNGNIAFDKAGNLYGTTGLGEDLDGACCYGQVFELIPGPQGWTKSALHRFTGPPGDGSTTGSGVVLDAAGDVYGTTNNGGTSGNGVVFEITAGGLELGLGAYPTPLVSGASLTYTFKVWNQSSGVAVHEVLTTEVPPGTTFSGITISGTPGVGSCSTPAVGGTGPVICKEGSSMKADSTWTVRMTVEVTAATGTVITETATASSDNLASTNATVSNTVSVPGLNLQLAASSTPPVPGGLMTYTFKVWNQSSVNAVHEVLTTQVPAGTTFSSIELSGTAGLGSCTTPAVGDSGPVVCHENSVMRPNSTWTISMTVQVTAAAGTLITETATASSDNLASTTVTVDNTVH